jgi:tRNA(Ile2) C34 agmatinyltransferase TiaS
VTCGQCGQHTDDWLADEPRLFRLRTATLGGMVSFKCRQCKARIIKRHFKDKVDVETQPHHETKGPQAERLLRPSR